MQSVTLRFTVFLAVLASCTCDLPDHFSWLDEHPECFQVVDQGGCGSCYANSAVSQLSSRLCLAKTMGLPWASGLQNVEYKNFRISNPSKFTQISRQYAMEMLAPAGSAYSTSGTPVSNSQWHVDCDVYNHNDNCMGCTNTQNCIFNWNLIEANLCTDSPSNGDDNYDFPPQCPSEYNYGNPINYDIPSHGACYGGYPADVLLALSLTNNNQTADITRGLQNSVVTLPAENCRAYTSASCNMFVKGWQNWEEFDNSFCPSMALPETGPFYCDPINFRPKPNTFVDIQTSSSDLSMISSAFRVFIAKNDITIEQAKAAVQTGPVSFGINNADNLGFYFNHYCQNKGSSYTPPMAQPFTKPPPPPSKPSGHTMMIVGWRNLNGVDVWIVQNSWGTVGGCNGASTGSPQPGGGYIYLPMGEAGQYPEKQMSFAMLTDGAMPDGFQQQFHMTGKYDKTDKYGYMASPDTQYPPGASVPIFIKGKGDVDDAHVLLDQVHRDQYNNQPMSVADKATFTVWKQLLPTIYRYDAYGYIRNQAKIVKVAMPHDGSAPTIVVSDMDPVQEMMHKANLRPITSNRQQAEEFIRQASQTNTDERTTSVSGSSKSSIWTPMVVGLVGAVAVLGLTTLMLSVRLFRTNTRPRWSSSIELEVSH